MNAKRQVVVVTGGSAGVGRAVARELGRRKAMVGLIARGADGLEATKREVEAAGGTALALSVDVADENAVEAAAARVELELGPMDVWINNAMCSVFSPAVEMEMAELRRVTDVTYLGAVAGTLAALRRMRTRNRGVIVQVGSALAYRSIPLQSAYCAAKHALVGFTDSLRSELLAEQSRVALTVVCLPALNTPQFGWVKSRLARKGQPVPPIFQPEVAARAILHAAAHPRRQWFVGAPTLLAVYGQALFPGRLDRQLARHGADAQQTDEPEDPSRPDNLFLPVPGDHGAHGTFDDRASGSSPQLWVDQHAKGLLTAAGVTTAAGLLLWALGRRRR